MCVACICASMYICAHLCVYNIHMGMLRVCVCVYPFHAPLFVSTQDRPLPDDTWQPFYFSVLLLYLFCSLLLFFQLRVLTAVCMYVCICKCMSVCICMSVCMYELDDNNIT